MAAAAAKKATKRTATLADLKNKPRRKETVTIKVPDEDGDIIELSFVLQAIGHRAYDDLIAQYPPTEDQRIKDNAQYNPDTFGPALIAACSFDPQISPNEAAALWVSEEWSRGEVFELFQASIRVCNIGFDIPFTVPVSAGTPASPSS